MDAHDMSSHMAHDISCASELSEGGGVFEWLKQKRNEVIHAALPPYRPSSNHLH
jgi:hypothetical protein